MINLLSKIFKNKDSKTSYFEAFKNLNKKTNIEKIFNLISNFSETSEIRYVGGSIRKIINREVVDDIDLATTVNPLEVCEKCGGKLSKQFNQMNFHLYGPGFYSTDNKRKYLK